MGPYVGANGMCDVCKGWSGRFRTCKQCTWRVCGVCLQREVLFKGTCHYCKVKEVLGRECRHGKNKSWGFFCMPCLKQRGELS